jgi:hypothetical protein
MIEPQITYRIILFESGEEEKQSTINFNDNASIFRILTLTLHSTSHSKLKFQVKLLLVVSKVLFPTSLSVGTTGNLLV